MSKEIRLSEERSIHIKDECYREFARYVQWRNASLFQAGEEIAARMPTFYGNVQLNLQGGHCVNVNVFETIKK